MLFQCKASCPSCSCLRIVEGEMGLDDHIAIAAQNMTLTDHAIRFPARVENKAVLALVFRITDEVAMILRIPMGNNLLERAIATKPSLQELRIRASASIRALAELFIAAKLLRSLQSPIMSEIAMCKPLGLPRLREKVEINNRRQRRPNMQLLDVRSGYNICRHRPQRRRFLKQLLLMLKLRVRHQARRKADIPLGDLHLQVAVLVDHDLPALGGDDWLRDVRGGLADELAPSRSPRVGAGQDADSVLDGEVADVTDDDNSTLAAARVLEALLLGSEGGAVRVGGADRLNTSGHSPHAGEKDGGRDRRGGDGGHVRHGGRV